VQMSAGGCAELTEEERVGLNMVDERQSGGNLGDTESSGMSNPRNADCRAGLSQWAPTRCGDVH